MAFDMGWNFRDSAPFVTDDVHYGVPCLGEAYPHTYTNGDGQSLNAGWVTGPSGTQDLVNTNDPRLAGKNYCNNSLGYSFKADLSSGSAPGAGTYVIDLAAGQPAGGGGNLQALNIKDNTTVLVDLTNGGAGTATNTAGDYIDATDTLLHSQTTSWGGTTVTKTFATATVILEIVNPGSGFSTPNHFRLTLQAAGAAVFPPRMLMLLGVGA
jgi:hypothetical protein